MQTTATTQQRRQRKLAPDVDSGTQPAIVSLWVTWDASACCVCVFRSQTHSLRVVPRLGGVTAVWEEGRAAEGRWQKPRWWREPGGREMGRRGPAGSPRVTFKEILTHSTTKECKHKHQFSLNYHRQKMRFPCPGHSPIRLCREETWKKGSN